MFSFARIPKFFLALARSVNSARSLKKISGTPYGGWRSLRSRVGFADIIMFVYYSFLSHKATTYVVGVDLKVDLNIKVIIPLGFL